MTPTRVALLWHLHQPDYRDPRGGVPLMPWVRLHGLRGYRDMIVESLAAQPAMTINVVPVLLEQLDHYAGGGSDPHLDLTRVPADALDGAQISAMRATFVGGHPDMVRAWPRWAALSQALHAGLALTAAELRDIQVWSTLAWFGATAERDLPVVKALRSKGQGFDEADKSAMLQAADEILRELPGQLVRLSQGRTALSVSPYHHPILPLLVDVQHARRADPELPRDLHFSWPDDARAQIDMAVAFFEARFGRRPRGMWPSEGAVSPEVVELMGQADLRWLCTDGGVLERSAHTAGGKSGGGWELGHGVVGFFRDRDLSDRVGFHYRARAPYDAVKELMTLAGRRCPGGTAVVALDGENPWEAWPGAGAGFRAELYRALDRQGISLDDAAEQPRVGRVTRLHTGSWIGADLRVWSGAAADHAAWRLLAEARRAVEASDRREEGLKRVWAAEGSDWFWWFGPEFSTPFAATFDALFRAHLASAWEAIGQVPPASLSLPVWTPPYEQIDLPHGLVEPAESDGWRGAGRLRWPAGGSMASAIPAGDALYGWDHLGTLWITAPWLGEVPREVEVEADVPTELRVDPELLIRVPSGGVRFALHGWVGDRRWRLPAEGFITLIGPQIGAALTWWSV